MEFRPKLVIVRHGETVWNSIAKDFRTRKLKQLPKNLRGVPNPRTWLSKKGRAQARATGKGLARLHGAFDAIFFSPWTRTTETTDLIIKGFSPAARNLMDFVRFPDLLLTEQNPGYLDPGITDDPEEEHRMYQRYRKLSRQHGPFHLQQFNVESWSQVAVRALIFLQKFQDKKYQGKKILIVTHGITTLLLRYQLEGLSEQEILKIHDEDHPHNCGVYEYEWVYREDNYRLKMCNQTYY